MYRVKNASQKDLMYEGRKVAPGEGIIVMNKIADRKIFKIGMAECEISSLCGEHMATCKEGIECFPIKGEDSTVFTIQ